MKYTTQEAMQEIMRRSEAVSMKRYRRACQRLSAAAGTLLAALVLVIALLPGKAGSNSAGSVYGSFLLSEAAGGYVLAAVIAFVLGVVVTLYCFSRRNKAAEKKDTERKEE